VTGGRWFHEGNAKTLANRHARPRAIPHRSRPKIPGTITHVRSLAVYMCGFRRMTLLGPRRPVILR
jgi:hypothetical protein